MQDLVRLLVCGSVDDGKSSLIGRLLFDTKAVLDDQLEALERVSLASGHTEINLANLTDGLKAEREQGITIDVAYRFFSTEKRRFIIADTPGHVQYTRNMVTGASTADVAIILIDARKGVIEQTKRHSYIANKLGIKNIILAINKMDQVEYSKDIFDKISADYNEFIKTFNFDSKQIIPITALYGDNLAFRSKNLDWYTGDILLDYLEKVKVTNEQDRPARLPVQSVIRPESAKFDDFRGYTGQITSGKLEVGQNIMVLPTGKRSSIKEILIGEERVQSAVAPLSVIVQLNDDIDLGRGYTIIAEDTLPATGKEVVADICWLSESELVLRKKYILKSLTGVSPVLVTELVSKVDINTLVEQSADKIILNDLAKIRLKAANFLVYDDYEKDRKLGAFILIDEHTNQTVAAGMINSKQEIEFSI